MKTINMFRSLDKRFANLPCSWLKHHSVTVGTFNLTFQRDGILFILPKGRFTLHNFCLKRPAYNFSCNTV